MAKKKKKLKKNVKILFIGLIIIIIGIFAFIKVRNEYIYRQTYEYKLLEKGYDEKETKLLLKYLKDDKLDKLLENEKDTTLISLMKNKYYHNDKLDRYLKFLEDNHTDLNMTIKTVNLNHDYDYYELNLKADTSLEYEMLVNKYYLLTKDYSPKDLVKIPSKYAWGDEKFIRKEAYNAFLNMWNAAQRDDIYLMINSAYRSYTDQEEVYNSYKESKGDRYADSIAARPGASEHQTGLALDIFDINNSSKDTFKESEAYKWLIENSYKFGFILRYPDDSEDITGYDPESWHYRYVGIKLAKTLKELGITLDEYYANIK